uniref:RING-type E3 ubiquitin transferase n=1 Tax=Echeneis naucrates TaxID=173247 RepID=A0A665TZJ7_ECHNA
MLTLSADMDESSSLLDLLECSVCLERLDTTAKVLPCQHTFCRRCLENIVSSRNELRCPECRILVDCEVDDLPANILLVRLLDGIKQRPQRGSGGGVGAGGRQSLNIPALPCGKALYSYEGKEPGDLQFSKGDIIILRRKVDDNWYHGELNGCHGFLPASYIQLLRPLSQTPPQGKALYDFEVKDKDQDKDCLAFSKDEVLTVIRRVDENWAEGMLGDKIGIFPILYVELNETAKQLMEIDKPTPTNVPGPSSEVAPLGPCSPGPSPSASPSNGNGSGHRRGEGKKNSKKRHSFTALSVSQRTTQLNNRHSMEISHPVLISSSDPRAASRIQRYWPCSTDSATTFTPPLVKDEIPPQKADELELRKGEMYRVTEKCQDGWFKGTSLRTAASGVFPGNYVTPVSRLVSSASRGIMSFPHTDKSESLPASLFVCCLAPPCLHTQKERKAGGLLKLLSGAAAKKKPRSPPSSPPTHNPLLAGQGAVATDLTHHPHHHHHHARSGSCPMASQGRAGSCPIESEMAGAMGLEPLHRKSGSLDTNFPMSPPATRACNPLMHNVCLSVFVRYRVVVPYPPQSEAEIELREGDVVFVHKKREDGWYKGTLQRTGQTGLFPSSFVESF